MFTRKHYKAFADILRETHANSETITEIAKYFKQDNDRFNKDKFYEACGIAYKGQ